MGLVMTLLEIDQPWPEELRMDQGAGMLRRFPKYFSDVINNGLYAFMAHSGEKPTRLLIHPKFKNVMKTDKLLAFQHYVPARFRDTSEEFMGMRIINTPDVGLALL